MKFLFSNFIPHNGMLLVLVAVKLRSSILNLFDVRESEELFIDVCRRWNECVEGIQP